MKLNQVIARRYAHALLELASNQQALSDVHTSVTCLHEALLQTPSLQKQLNNPLITNADKLKMFQVTLQKMQAPASIGTLIQLLAQNNRLPLLPAVLAAFILEAEKAAGTVRAHVTSAAPLTDSQKIQVAQLAARISSTTDTQKIKMMEHVKPQLLAGTCIQVGSLQLDLTLQNKLNRLHAAMTH